jgi:hypothetical protein
LLILSFTIFNVVLLLFVYLALMLSVIASFYSVVISE